MLMSTHDRKRSQRTLYVALGLILSTSCAKVVAPPGGPEDKSPPALLASTPYSHQTGVGPINEMEIVFSEELDSRNIEKSVFVTPRQNPPVKVKAKGERLLIKFPDTLLENQTYIVTVSANIADLRRNTLGESRTIAFTRGALIDSNFISGVVTSDDEPAEGITLGLFRDFTPSKIGDLDSLYPDYLTVSGANGQFEFSFLPPGEFFLLGFADKDKNERFSYGIEKFAIPAELPAIGQHRQDNLELRMRQVDTSSVSVLGVTTTADGLVRVNFTRPVEPQLFSEHLSSVYLMEVNDSNRTFPARALVSPRGARRKRLEFYIPTESDGDYRFNVDYNQFFTDRRDAGKITYSPYSKETPADSTPPALTNNPTTRKTISGEAITWELEFSEPVTFDSLRLQGIGVEYSDKRALRFTVSRLSPLSLAVTSAEELLPGADLALTLDSGAIYDHSGNSFPDSALSFPHQIWPQDSLGTLYYSIENRFDSLYDGEYLIDFKRLSDPGQNTYRQVVKTTDSLRFTGPAGDYVVEVTVDSETKLTPESRDDGDLYPFRLAERRAFYPDTVRIRPRFENSGVNVILE